MMSEKFGFPGRHIHIDWALRLARLAGEAEIERFFYFLIPPTVGDRLALQHLPQQVSAAAGGVFLLPAGHVAGAHGAVVLLAACPYSHATKGGFTESAWI